MKKDMERLLQAHNRLIHGEWPEDVLGEMPDFHDKKLVTVNAGRAIENIVGEAAISRFYYTKDGSRTEEDWLRWYAVGRFRYEVRTRVRKQHNQKIILAIVAILAAIAVHIARYLLGL